RGIAGEGVGLSRGRERVPPDDEIAALLQQVGMPRVQLDPDGSAVRFAAPALEVGEKTITGEVKGKNGYLLEMEGFFNSIRTGAPVACDWKQGLAVCVAAIRANEAMEKNKRVEIPAMEYEP